MTDTDNTEDGLSSELKAAHETIAQLTKSLEGAKNVIDALSKATGQMSKLNSGGTKKDDHLKINSKLKGKVNYSTWSFAMRPMLKRNGLWKCTGQDPPDINVSDEVKNNAMLALLNNMVDDQITEITTFEDEPWRAWARLKELYEGKTVVDITILKQELRALNAFPQNLTYEAAKRFFDEVKKRNNQIAKVDPDEKLDDKEIGMQLISALCKADPPGDQATKRFTTMADRLLNSDKKDDPGHIEAQVLGALKMSGGLRN